MPVSPLALTPGGPEIGPGRSRERRARLVLALGSVAAVLLSFEAGLRLLRYQPARYQNPAHVLNTRRTVGLDCFPSNPRGYFDLDLRDPALRERYEKLRVNRLNLVVPRAPHAIELRYNSLGYRGGELAPKSAGVGRVIVLGDSFTEGVGVKEADTYPAVLERALGASEPGKWEVLNAGRRATDFPALYHAFEELLAHDPDVLVYGMVLNDCARSAEFEAREPFANDWVLDRQRLLGGRPETRLGFFEPRLGAFLHDRIETWQVARQTERWYRDMYGPPNQRGWESTQQMIREMDRRMRERGGRFLLVSWPLLVGLEGRYPLDHSHEAVARFCRAAQVHRHDLLPVFRGHPSASLWVHPADLHPNEVAHRMAAESLAPVLRDLVSARP